MKKSENEVDDINSSKNNGDLRKGIYLYKWKNKFKESKGE